MARKLVVCCDGTWNTPRTATNIFRTYEFLRRCLVSAEDKVEKDGVRTTRGKAADGSEVVLFYDQGVGTDWFARLVGGGAGVGLSDNVRDAYHFLGHHFEPGSEIYAFGFSRGAYTARSLCGFVAKAGLIKRPTVQQVWRAYMDRYATAPGILARPAGLTVDGARRWLREKAGDLVGRLGDDVDSLPRHDGVKIRFIGVYDTVGALGVPIAAATRVNEPIVGFHDTTLGSTVEHAVQALAVDEKRGPYVPTLWTHAKEAALAAGQSVLQVWFPGVHSDVGGGYLHKGIGDITLDFMLRQAARRGLVIDPAQPTPADLTLAPLPPQHESFDEKWEKLSTGLGLIPRGVRSIGPTLTDATGTVLTVAGEVRLHPSLVGRFGQRCVTILDEKDGIRREGVYEPENVKADTLSVFA